MKIIRKIIKWFIDLLKKIFGIKTVSKKIKSSINNQSNKYYLNKYGLNNGNFDESFPVYLMIDNSGKEELINKIKIIEEKVKNEEKRIINDIEKVIKNKKISFYQKELINEKIENIIEDKNIEVDTTNKIITLDQEIIEILENYDKNIKEKTRKEFEEVNYVTLTTLLLDETKDKIEKLEDDFRHHKYNKYYYEREIKKIRMHLNNLMTLRSNESVKNEINELRNNLYTKKKDKYDLLFNDEVFYNFDKECDDLLKKVNRRIIDLKKESITKEEKKERKEEKKNKKEDKKEEIELLENILKRFKDMELARKVLLINSSKKIEINNNSELISYIDSFYLDFVSGEKFKFNYDRNKTKLELTKLLNNMLRVNCSFNNQEFIPFEHINYSMEDLVTFASFEKEELDNILESRYNYEKEKDEINILVDNKLNILKENKKEKDGKNKVFVKTNNEK